MLPTASRLRRKAEFTATTRGRRTSRPSLVLYIRPTGQPARAGFIVAKSVGQAVVRNRVKRRLRHLMAERLSEVRADVVIRALPAAAQTPDRLTRDVDSAWAWAKTVGPKVRSEVGTNQPAAQDPVTDEPLTTPATDPLTPPPAANSTPSAPANSPSAQPTGVR
ncbi:MAG: ribonuclease P protein component [Propionibacteriaceae bacterium]|jgi:ribonuclease P protein component|nr:ribonuclease P protein component [Propionibacteriaceae bacterium]